MSQLLVEIIAKNIHITFYGNVTLIFHDPVFGPYTCPVSECGRRLESGVKVMQHMHSHLGPRAQALAQGQKFSCADCNAIYTTASRFDIF